ncbi:hypothetical protein E8E14_012293 [Neopestalotiopsis sp. 37M]|jgi:hypothetical protein|nr:hypothetical protein E8E14_012293 [Neopestalotiopsis sp. 37M]
MFDNPQWAVDSTRKRARDEEEALLGTTGFTEHRNKRLHSLPLRSSPGHKRWTGPPPTFPSSALVPSTITPSDSDSEDLHQQQHLQQNNESHMSSWPYAPGQPQQQQQSPDSCMDADRDTDMMVTEDMHHLNPGSAQPDIVGSSITGRMPTPIHATFAAQVRGNNWGAANGSSDMQSSYGTAFPRAFPPSQDPTVPRSAENVAEWSMVQNRRLPSPISESGGEDAPTSPGMVLDSSPAMQRPYLPHMPHSTNPAMAHPNVEIVTPRASTDDVGMMDMEEGQDGSPTSAPATPSPRSKFGHSRSKHTLNSWTLQPGMKKSFSIGYRADCEKCRLKIPGHFNHIIVS